MSKFIFVTGGVLSGIGKGIVVSSLGNLLKYRGYSVFIIKLDPYLNVDPGVLSPYEHGEVYVTEDGGETDLDLGHYERFTDENFSKDSNYTSGKILSKILEKERQGFYNGKTLQYIPHVSDEIINILKNVEKKYNTDFVLVEIGGTVGDIESNLFLYAISQMGYESDFENSYYVHLTYVPFLETSQDFKTKPTQFSVSKLHAMGIRPNMIFLRTHKELNKETAMKVAKASLLPIQNVVSIPDLKNVYEIPLYFEEKQVVQSILDYFKLEQRPADLTKWEEFESLYNAKKEETLKIMMLGKYTEFVDAYKSIVEALRICAVYNKLEVDLKFLDTTTSAKKQELNLENLKTADGVVILPGFGKRGFENKVRAAAFTKEHNIPTFGICLGMQAMTVAQARHKGIINANSKEFASDKDEVYVLDFNTKNGDKLQIGGTLRLGASEVEFKKDSLIAKIYKTDKTTERHRHRYEVVKEFVPILEDERFVFSAKHPQSELIEACEDPQHNFYIGVQYHPEFLARPLRPHPLFDSFLKAALKYKHSKKEAKLNN
ncbi:CTP synthase [Mesomycoplasma hyorhinis]|uniref:CTP synthase (glutamine hydrolyzing) n=3 Tax=Mesomycoplasma hyorhinis TaxID=2100 RepID=A0ABD6II03_MESHY|nr:CTP synthase [Mesomycoplasma hyorhinis]AEX14086.1 CTP synthase [Mesomycoplasma hyorhinis GDL-1]AFX74231.1 CTP synthase [Mesomycoplasma hyorhinis SK76]AHA41082.1 CTP synthase [Mesomycoplasma hyorhinis DBS 1050]MXR06367.1 CTP synthase [Mesomycoplasma hyorhinis]MXR07095.1 CTP synthase [Mesomycoplasma hyorhinis]